LVSSWIPFDKRDYNYLELPGKDVWGILMRKDSLLTSHEHFTRAEVSKLPLLVSEQEIAEGNHSGLSGWLHKNFEDLNIVATYNLLYNASLLVQEGMGYALTIDKLANTGPDSLCVLSLSLHVWKLKPISFGVNIKSSPPLPNSF
jgi:hypothetical protein